jgi:hypothetical protein
MTLNIAENKLLGIGSRLGRWGECIARTIRAANQQRALFAITHE